MLAKFATPSTWFIWIVAGFKNQWSWLILLTSWKCGGVLFLRWKASPLRLKDTLPLTIAGSYASRESMICWNWSTAVPTRLVTPTTPSKIGSSRASWCCLLSSTTPRWGVKLCPTTEPGTGHGKSLWLCQSCWMKWSSTSTRKLLSQLPGISRNSLTAPQ